jgi:hypothetical protein
VFFGRDEIFSLLEQLQALSVERLLINSSTNSFEEAEIAARSLQQRLNRLTRHLATVPGSSDDPMISPSTSLSSLHPSMGDGHSAPPPSPSPSPRTSTPPSLRSPSPPPASSLPYRPASPFTFAVDVPPDQQPSTSGSMSTSTSTSTSSLTSSPVPGGKRAVSPRGTPMGGGGIESLSGLSATPKQLFALKTKSEHLHAIFRIPLEENLLHGTSI